MNSFILQRGPFALLFICLLCGDGWGATSKVDCHAEREQLMTHEAAQCSGFGYLFNPSACIRARNELAAFNAKPCRQPVGDELSQQPASPAAHSAVVIDSSTVKESLPQTAKIAGDAVASNSDIEQLRLEIDSLRAELQQLRREVAAIKSQLK